MSDYLSDAEVIARIIKIREAKGLTVVRLAELSGVSRSRLADLELGRRTQLHLQETIAVTEALGLDFTTFITKKELRITTAVYVV